jgi:DNA-binding beta-propeller fold protein YncE
MVRIAGLALTLLLVAPAAGAAQASNGGHPKMARGRGWISVRADATHAWLYAGEYDGNAVNIYDLESPGLPQIGQITSGVSEPGGIAIDNLGALYVVNRTGSVTIYPPRAVEPSLTLTDGIGDPIAVTTDAERNVYVTNRGKPPDIVVFPPGQTTLSRVIAGSLIRVPTQIVADGAGDLYLADNVTGISEVFAGSLEPRRLGLANLVEPSGIALDAGRNQLYVSQGGSGNIKVFQIGDADPIRRLPGTNDCDLLAFAQIRGQQYLFVPHTRSDVVALYRAGSRHAHGTVETPAWNLGAAIKPAGVP